MPDKSLEEYSYFHYQVSIQVGKIETDGGQYLLSNGHDAEAEHNKGIFPPGTHGIRWNDPLSICWMREGELVKELPNEGTDDPQNAGSDQLKKYWKDDGNPTHSYNYLAGILSTDDEIPKLDYPLDFGNGIEYLRARADTLVVQMGDPSISFVEYLDKTDSPFVPGTPQPGPANPWSSNSFKDLATEEDWCELHPESCEPSPDPNTWPLEISLFGGPLFHGDPGFDSLDLAKKQDQAEQRLLRLRDISAALIRHLDRTCTILQRSGRRPDTRGASVSQRKALQRISCAREFVTAVDQSRRELLTALREG